MRFIRPDGRLRTGRQAFVALLIGVSAISTLLGLREIIAFDATPGEAGGTPAEWPAASRIERTAGRPELLLFAHPYCSCTSATLNELARMRVKARPAITVLFYRLPHEADAPPLWKNAEALPGSRVMWDEGGSQAALFGARTSGYVALYNASGRLLFHGGVTASRGHEGDNSGLDELTAAIESGRPNAHVPFVFGCALGGRSVQ